MKQRLKILTFLFLLLAISTSGFTKQIQSQENLESLIEVLLTRNPELRSLVHQINASQNRVAYSASLDDPRFMIEVMNLPTGDIALNRTPMTGIQLYLKQQVPFPTKLVTRKKLAKSQYEQEQQEYFEKMNQLVAKFKKIYYDYAYVSEAIRIHNKNKRRLDSLASVLEARYSTGKTPQQDVLKTKLESNQLESEITRLQQAKKILLARLNTLLVRSPNSPIQMAKDNSAELKLQYNLDDLLEFAKKERPWLKKADSQIRETKQSSTLAKEELLPDFDFAVGYRIRDNALGDPVMGEDFLSAGVTVNIPFLWTLPKHVKKISEYKNKELAQQQYRESLQQEVVYQVTQYFYDLERLRDQIRLYQNTILPESRLTVDSSLVYYEARSVDFMNLITSQMSLYRNELQLTQYRYDYAKTLADLEMAIGRPLRL